MCSQHGGTLEMGQGSQTLIVHSQFHSHRFLFRRGAINNIAKLFEAQFQSLADSWQGWEQLFEIKLAQCRKTFSPDLHGLHQRLKLGSQLPPPTPYFLNFELFQFSCIQAPFQLSDQQGLQAIPGFGVICSLTAQLQREVAFQYLCLNTEQGFE